MRLAKYIASCGIASRRKAEELIVGGKVSLNGTVITNVATSIEPTDSVTVEGKKVIPETKVYYLLNKPRGYTSTTEDEHAEKLITELVPQKPPVWPVGRLDRDTTGLIILTNDGELTQKLTHPSYKKEKEYLAKLTKPLSMAKISEMKKGIRLEDGPFKPDKFDEIAGGEYRLIIHEGRNRLIRRAFEHLGSSVVALERVRISRLELGDLKEGKYRSLTENDLERLTNA